MTRSRSCMSITVVCLALFFCAAASAQEQKSDLDLGPKAIPPGSKVFVDPMAEGFETYLVAGIIKKQVPLIVVNDKSKADFEIAGISESEKAGWAKMFFMGTDASREQASIKITNLKRGEVVFAYAVNKGQSARGKQSAAEACAKHLKEKIESKK